MNIRDYMNTVGLLNEEVGHLVDRVMENLENNGFVHRANSGLLKDTVEALSLTIEEKCRALREGLGDASDLVGLHELSRDIATPAALLLVEIAEARYPWRLEGLR